jgi:8-oxo-dGTP diphosphatase
MARVPVLAAGGIVLRRQQPPLIAVVRLRKRDEWVLPKGKLDDGETPRAAARREVLEETGHNVTVHEFLGTLAYDSGGRSKIVHYWRMEAGSEQAHDLMHDVRAVDWLPLGAAVERLSRPYEQAFLANVGPQALASFAARRQQKAKAPMASKRRGQPAVAPPAKPAAKPAPALPELPRAEPAPELELVEPVPEVAIAAPVPVPPEPDSMPEPVALAGTPLFADEAPSELPSSEVEREMVASPLETEFGTVAPVTDDDRADDTSVTSDRQPRSLAQKVRDWLGRAA